MKLKTTLLATLLAASSAQMAFAEEGGTGHYMPGSMSSFIDAVPTSPLIAARLNVINYSGSVDKDVKLPFGSRLVADADVDIHGLGLTFVWRPENTMPEGWSYGVSATIPLINVKVSGVASPKAFPNISRSLADSETGLGDIIVQPLMLNYQANPDFATNFRVSIYAPTGDYTAGKIANTGKNYWSFEPTLGMLYFGKQNGIEAALYTGVTFNTDNNATDYHSGTQFHLDGTLAQHFPLWGGLAGAGVSGYYYQQIAGDSGSGATLGDFKAMTSGVGPALSYITKVGDHQLTTELKWLHEFETERRIKGDTVFFKLLGSF